MIGNKLDAAWRRAWRMVPRHRREKRRGPSRHQLWRAQGGKCCWCLQRVPKKDATIEHLRPLALGGTWHADNLRMACGPCNHMRGHVLGKYLQTRKPEWVERLLLLGVDLPADVAARSPRRRLDCPKCDAPPTPAEEDDDG